MSNTEQHTKIDSAVRAPSAKMIAAVKTVAAYRGVAVPEGFETDYHIAKAFLSEGGTSRFATAKKFIAESGASVLHFRPTIHLPFAVLENTQGGMTVVFRRDGDILQLATAICNNDTEFNDKLGVVFAAERLANNQFIRVPLKGQSPEDVVIDMFAHQFEQAASVVVLQVRQIPQEFEAPAAADETEHTFAPVPAAGAFGKEFLGFIKELMTASAAVSTSRLRTLVQQIVPVGEGESEWNASARQFLEGVVSGLETQGNASYDELCKVVLTFSNDDVAKLLAGTPAEKMVAAEKAFDAIRSTAAHYINAVDVNRGAADSSFVRPRFARILDTDVAALMAGLPPFSLADAVGKLPPGLASLGRLFARAQAGK